MEKSHNYRAEVSRQCEWILYALVVTLVLEGVVRKLLPVLSLPIFFFKDVLCLLGLLIIFKLKLFNTTKRIIDAWWRLFLLFIPLLYFTGFKDPVLSVFAAKQYLLYISVGIIMAIAFSENKDMNFRKFIFFNSLLLIPTTLIAIIQLSLPPTHWLNASVGGESMEAFSAAGYLRVGSTFSFTAQYSWYLNVESCFLLASIFISPNFSPGYEKFVKWIVYPLLALMLVIGAFITGGRTAVFGCGSTLALGFFFIGCKNPKWMFSKGLLILSLSIISLFGLRLLKPEFFQAYDARASGNEKSTHSEEMADRIFGGFTDWTSWFWEQDLTSVVAGNGLGIMSNGSSQISSYARTVRADGFWTEGDVPTTFWEGGLYLAIIWYGFRLSMIIFCLRQWYSINDKTLGAAASVPLAYVIIHGTIAQLGMQPPLFIWWWFAIGIIFFLRRFDKFQTLNRIQKTFLSKKR